MDIYYDVITIYNWFEGEIFGVEIKNEKVVLMNKQLFELGLKQSITLTHTITLNINR